MRGKTGRCGRPRATSARKLEMIALELYRNQGYDETTIEQIATVAGVSTRTFFRYFECKSAVLWYSFDRGVEDLQAAFRAASDDQPLMDSIRSAILAVNKYGPDQIDELRNRLHLVNSVPAIKASSTQHYDAWERAVTEYAGQRLGQRPDLLIPRSVGYCTLAACRAAFERWVEGGEAELTVYLDRALRSLAVAFEGG